MKKLIELAIILVLFGISSWAQEVRNEVTVQGSGFFNKQITGSGTTSEPTNSGGVMPDTDLTSRTGSRSKGITIISEMVRS
jgi:hypothetical protein